MDLPNPGIESRSPTLQAYSLPPGKPHQISLGLGNRCDLFAWIPSSYLQALFSAGGIWPQSLLILFFSLLCQWFFAHHSTFWESLTNRWPHELMDCPLLVSQLQTHTPSSPLSWGVGLLLTLPIGGARERMNSRGGKGASGFPSSKLLWQNLLLSEESHRLSWCLSDLSIFASAACVFFLWLHSAQVWKLPPQLSDGFLLKIPSFEIPRVSSDFLTGSWQVKLVTSRPPPHRRPAAFPPISFL